jgi:uncharacterized protein
MNLWLGQPMINLVLRMAGLGMAVYLALCLGLYVGQTRLMFFPPAMIMATPDTVALQYEEVWIPVGTGHIHGWWIPATTVNAPIALVLHGNSSNVGHMVSRAAQLHQFGLAVLVIDYRGYGRSSGPFPTESRLYDDVEAAWNYLIQERRSQPDQIILYGISLGGALAIELASRHPTVAGVIAESTFTSMREMAKVKGLRAFPIDWLLTQRFDSLAKLRSLNVPVLFIHGTADPVVPFSMSLILFETASEPKYFLCVPNAGHNNVGSIGGKKYIQALQQFIQTIRDR